MTFKIEKISGTGDGDFVCGVFSKHVTLADGSSGVLANCVLISGEGLKSIENVGTFLHEGFESDARKLAEKENGLLSMVSEVGDAGLGRFEQANVNASFAVAFFYKDAVYIARHGEKIKISIFRAPKSFNVGFDLGSGKLVGGDLVLISTGKFIETFDSGVFASGGEVDFEDIIDGLATDISALEEQSEVGAVFVQVKGEKVKEIVGDGDGEGTVNDTREVKAQEQGTEPAPPAALGVQLRGGISLSRFVSAIFGEIAKLRIGDLGAIFRLRRNLIFLALILVVVLFASGFFTIKGKMNAGQDAEFNGHLAVAESKYEEALGVLELNRQKARQLLVEADNALKLALVIFPQDGKALGLGGQISERLKQTENLATVTFNTFYNGSGGVVSLSRGSGNFFVFGDDGVYEVDGAGKGKKASGESVQGGYVYDSSTFLLSGGNVSKLNAQGEAQEVAKGQNVRDVAVFLGNIYLLGGDEIVKFVPIEGGYAQGSDYLEDSLSFSSDSRFAIDGSIWVTNGQEILQFTRGTNNNFKIEGISGLGTLGEIYTNSDSSKLYVIDRSNSALLVVGKDGAYEKSYNSGEFAKARDLFVDELNGKMYITSGSRVLVADL